MLSAVLPDFSFLDFITDRSRESSFQPTEMWVDEQDVKTDDGL